VKEERAECGVARGGGSRWGDSHREDEGGDHGLEPGGLVDSERELLALFKLASL
jgi:hypothetical protein